MSSSEKLAIAAHLHVLLRRNAGRVTDTQWMATNQDYAQEVVRLAREKAAGEGIAELAVWAGKLEELMAATAPRRASPPVRRATDSASAQGSQGVAEAAFPSGSGFSDSGGDSGFADSQAGGEGALRQSAPRYVKGLR